MLKDIYYAIMGLVVGDALGVPYEMRRRGTFTAIDMVGGGVYRQPAGTWSDDSSLTLATLASIKEKKGKIIFDDIMDKFTEWYLYGEYTPHGKPFGEGATVRAALYNYITCGKKPLDCGQTREYSNGNGSLMRILPLTFFKHDEKLVARVSSLTHAHPVSVEGCQLYIQIADLIRKGYPMAVIREAVCDMATTEAYLRLKEIAFMVVPEDKIKSTGYVVDTLEAALYCLFETNSYADCVLKAANLGGDTDTIAAVAGGLAGLYYKDIPEEWVNKIARREWIEDLCDFSRLRKSLI